MTLVKNKPEGLLYIQEHVECKNYLTGNDALFEEINLESGELFIREFINRPSLLFILSGEIRVSIRSVVKRKVEAGNLLFVTMGDSFFGRALTDVTVIRCSFTHEISLCNKFALKDLTRFILPPPIYGAENKRVNELVMLDIHPILRKELELTMTAVQNGLLCSHFQRIKQDIILMEIRGLYKKEDLARLFEPLISNDEDFKIKVLETYNNIKTAKELAAELNMSQSSFKRKFNECFGTSPKHWLIQKKKEKLFRDIVMSEMTIKEIAEKYDFTVNYISSFCKKNFGKTPTELRGKHNSK